MKVTITDIITSWKIAETYPDGTFMVYMGCDVKNNQKYGWAFRIHHHTKEELEYGHSKNPQLVTMPFDEFCEKVGIPIKEEDKGKTLVAFPTKNGITFFFSFMPAFEVIPDGIEGTLVEVEI